MNPRHNKFYLISIIVAAAMLLAACQPAPTPCPTNTPTPLPPTPTATPAPVSGDPAVDLGIPDGVDPFDSYVNFSPLDNDCFTSEITGGQFVMTAKGVAGIYCWANSWPKIQDFYLETTTLMPDSCVAGDNFGMLFRSPSSIDGYIFGLNCSGQYSLRRVSDTHVTDLIPPTSSDKILVGAGQVNRMGVVAFGGSYYLYGNGYYLATASDYSFMGPGDIGYYVNATTTTPLVSRYLNMKVWKLVDAYYPPTAPPPAYPPVVPEPPSTGVPTASATTYVNVRTGPGMNYPILGVAPPGATAEVVGVSPDSAWYVVKISTTVSATGQGWVSAGYIMLTDYIGVAIPVIPAPPLPPQVIPPPVEEGIPAATALEPLNIRTGPSTSYLSYGVAPMGSSAPVVGRSEDGQWLVMTISTAYSPTGTGWANAPYILLTGTTLEELPVVPAPDLNSELPLITPPAIPEGSIVVTTTESVSVHEGPANDSTIYGKVAAGTALAAVGISEDGQWVAVTMPTTVVASGIGWVNISYLLPFDTTTLPVM
jgi:uncharacterized protein YraI